MDTSPRPPPNFPGGGSAPSRLRFSTDALPPADRIAYWQEAVCRAFVRLELDCDPRQPFTAALCARSLPRFDCIAVAGSAQRVSRSRRLVEHDRNDNMIVMWQQLGDCLVSQDGREARLQAGGLAVVDSRRPYALCFRSEFRQTVIRLPAQVLEQRLGRRFTCAGRVLPPARALPVLAAQVLDALAPEERDSLALPLSGIALDLLILALTEDGGDTVEAPGMAAMRVSLAKAQVMESLRDPALSPQAVAERQGVSGRLLQRHFAAEGESLAAFILEQRLQQCKARSRIPPRRT